MTRHTRLVLALAVCAPAVAPAAAAAATAGYPSITKVTPLKLGVGDTLTVRGKNFRAGHARTTLVFKRDGGRAIFVKAEKATKTQLTVVIPGKMANSLPKKAGKAITTRFRLRVLAGRFGRRYTATSASPLVGPDALTSKVASDDCDGDLLKNAADPDDDNDLLSDALEATLKTDPCKRDTDADGMSDGWEYESALDYNGRAKPSPTKRPYPNALDATDAAIDSDGDAMTNAQEYAAWVTFGGNKLPLNYSGGDPASSGKSAPAASYAFADRDANGFLSDGERDADGDGLPNQEEDLIDGFPDVGDRIDKLPRPLGSFSLHHITREDVHKVINDVPLYGPLKHTQKILPLNWLDADSDGDTIKDGADDSDGDDLSNVQELGDELAASGTSRELPINACAPNADARLCIVGDDDIDNDGKQNRVDDDDDGDLLSDTLEVSLGMNPYKEDTDGDGAGDGFEYYSAKDLNEHASPYPVTYPGEAPYPNPLDKTDGPTDHDGDGLSLVNEYKAWRYTGGALPLSYSDGNQTTSGGVIDAYRDVDGDGASNYAEVAGPLSGPEFWTKWVKDNNQGCPDGKESTQTVVIVQPGGTVPPPPESKYVESPYPGPKYKGLSFVDPDSDGDGVLDGADDVDHDGLSNIEESRYVSPSGEVFVRRPDWCQVYVSVGPNLEGQHGHNDPAYPADADPKADRYARIDPFNPCKPVYSEACHKFVPLGYYVKSSDYVEDWAGAKPNR